MRGQTLRKCEICGVRRLSKLTSGIFLSKFPLEANRCRLWVKATGNEDLAYLPLSKLNENKYICGDHFPRNMFNEVGNRLKKIAVPTLNLSPAPLSDAILENFPIHEPCDKEKESFSYSRDCEASTSNTGDHSEAAQIEEPDHLKKRNIVLANMGNRRNYQKKSLGWRRKTARHMLSVMRWKKNNPGASLEDYRREHEALLGDEWLSCQTDVNKLVQRNGKNRMKSESDNESVWPEDGDTVVGDAPADKKVYTKDIIKPVDVIDEEFTRNEKNAEKTEDAKKELISTEWVIQKFLCRCCLAEGDFTSFLTETHEDKSYEDLLQTCFNIQLLPVEGCAGALRALCGLCVARLQDAFAFSRQVKAAEERFRELFTNSCIKVTRAINVKEEEPNDTDDVDLFANEVTVTTDGFLVEDNSKRKKLKKKEKTLKPKQEKKTVVKKRADWRTRIDYEYYKLVGDSYKCTKCDKMFNQRRNCLKHFEGVHLKIKDKLKCPIPHCGEIFPSKCQRMLHKLEKHNIDERYKCNACDRYFNGKRQLLNHERSYHMLGEVIKCTLCDYVCYWDIYMRKHMVRHQKTKEFQCKYCEKAFLRRTTLNFHERIHTGDKRKECTECGETFVQKASLNYHMAKHHPGVRF